MKINDKIRTLREMNNLTQEDMADKLSMSTNGYANIERGESKIHTDKLERIAHILGMEVVDLMSFGEKNTVYHMVGDNNVNGLNIIGRIDDHEILLEVSQLKTQLAHYKELAEFQKQELQSLKDIIELLKKQSSSSWLLWQRRFGIKQIAIHKTNSYPTLLREQRGVNRSVIWKYYQQYKAKYFLNWLVIFQTICVPFLMAKLSPTV